MTRAAQKLYEQALDLSDDDRAQVTSLLIESLGKETDPPTAHLALTGALMLFETGRVSSGRAAELAGMAKVEFLEMCGKHKVSVFNYRPEELEAEVGADLATLQKTLA